MHSLCSKAENGRFGEHSIDWILSRQLPQPLSVLLTQSVDRVIVISACAHVCSVRTCLQDEASRLVDAL